MGTINNQFGPVSNTGDFVGGYMVATKKVIIAAVLADIPLVLWSREPGTGKTQAECAASIKMFPGESTFLRCDPTTEPEKIRGGLDPKLAFEQGIYVNKVDGTLFDPKWKMIILDEFSRLNDPGLDITMNILDRNDLPTGCSPWVGLTSNWLPKDERNRALMDRIGMIKYLIPDIKKPSDLTHSMLQSKNKRILDFGDGFPDAKTINDVREAYPDRATEEVIGRFLDNFADNAAKGLTDSNGIVIRSFIPNLRRYDHWHKLLYNVSAYAWGNNTFSEVHPYAKEMLAYAWVSTDENELADWQLFCGIGGVDPIDALIHQLMIVAGSRIKKIMQDPNRDRIINDSRHMGMFTSKSSREIAEALEEAGVANPEEDERYQSAVGRLTSAFVALVRNQDPYAGLGISESETAGMEGDDDTPF